MYCQILRTNIKKRSTISQINTSKVATAYLSVRIPEVTRQDLGELAFSLVQHFTHSVAETNGSYEPVV